MNSIFEFCDDLQKRLSRKVNDLKTSAPASALKELREHRFARQPHGSH